MEIAEAMVMMVAVCSLGIPGNAIRLPDCHPYRGIEIEETATNVSITCDQIDPNREVTWGTFTSPKDTFTRLGSCHPDGQCSDSPNPLTRPSSTTSVLTIVSPSRAWGSLDVYCGVMGSESRCGLSIIYSVSLTSSNCSIEVNTSSDPWTIAGSCYISKAFSSRQYYHCQWTQTFDTGVTSTPPNQADDQTSSPVRDYYSYTCRFSTPVPQLSGTYTYTVTAFPGNVTITAGFYHVELPSSPDSGCIDGYYIEGDTLDCTCTLSNPGRPEATPVWSHDVSSGPRLQMVVTSQDHHRRLTCQARWGNRNVTHTDYVIRIAYGPAQPVVSHKDQPYPFMAGESPTLYCSFHPGDDPGNPAATLSWRGHDGSANQTEAQLTLTQLSGRDNRRREVCEARNAFTDRRGSPVSTSMVIEVYYVDIRVTSLASDRCDRSTPNKCLVTEGERVHLECSADSNPALATVAWQHSGTPVLDLVVDGNTSTRHICNVTTVNNSDSRLPLQRSLQFVILVTTAGRATSKEPVDATVIGGAVAAAVVVVAVVVVVVIFIIQRRRKGNKTTGPRSQGGRDIHEHNLPGAQQHRSARRDNYEDMNIEPAPLAVEPEPEPAPEQAATPSGSDVAAVYSVVVKKGRGTQPAPSPNAETELYAVVNKKTPQSSRPSNSADIPDEENACAPPLPAPLSEVEAEPIAERTSEGARPEKGKAKGKRSKKGNPARSSAVSGHTNTVFENDDTAFIGSSMGETVDSSGDSRTVNQDGQVYVKVDFSDSQRRKEKEQPPARETTTYVDIDFAETARLAKR